MKRIIPSLWIPLDGITLEEAADKIVRSQDSYAVAAGPGAGKTELLAQRACFLLQTGTCPSPRKILAISFKRDAARNLADRVTKRIGDAARNRFEAKTYDAFAKSILDNFIQALPDNLRPVRNYEIVYRDADLSASALTFARVMELASVIIEKNPAILKALRITYSHVFLDEFQDTTVSQYDFIRKIFLGSDVVITAVGDDKQRIMGWAGALSNAFTLLSGDFSAQREELLFNHRCAPRLVDVQRHLASSMFSTSYEVKHSPRWDPDDGECLVYSFAEHTREARHLADLISHWVHTEGIPCRDICVLVRQKVQAFASPLIEELAKSGVSARDEDEFQKRLLDPLGEMFVQFLDLVIRKGKRPETFTKLRNRVLEVHGLVEVSQDKRYVEAIGGQLDELIQSTRANLSEADDPDAIRVGLAKFINLLDLRRIKRTFAHIAREEDVSSLKDWILGRLIDFREKCLDWEQAHDSLIGLTSIPIMTIHKAKGLEFDSVVLLGLDDSAYWSFPKNRKEEGSTVFVALSRAKRRMVITRVDMRVVNQRISGCVVARSVLAPIYEGFRKAGVSIITP